LEVQVQDNSLIQHWKS